MFAFGIWPHLFEYMSSTAAFCARMAELSGYYRELTKPKIFTIWLFTAEKKKQLFNPQIE